MEVVHSHCAGIDVHKDTLMVAAVTPGSGKKPTVELREVGTMTADLLAMVDWLRGLGVTHVAMESTGVYWKPVFNLLEGTFQVILANARHIKAVPGRKTDVRDCQWIAELLRHGLLTASFIPPAPIRELREWTRYRQKLVQERSAESNRIQKLLETMNIKLGSVASDVLGVSGRAMLAQLVAGETDPAKLADLAHGRLRDKREQLCAALTGRITANGRRLLREQLQHLEYLDQAVARCEAEIEAALRPFEAAAARLMTIPGVGLQSAASIIAEIGVDMNQFPSAAHLSSWAGICPGNNESAGKRRSGHTRAGNRWLCAALTQAAWGASHSKGTYLSAQYRRLAGRRGRKRAIVALGHSLLVIVYHLLKDDLIYQELGADFLDQRNKDHTAKRLAKRLQQLGYDVTLIPKTAA